LGFKFQGVRLRVSYAASISERSQNDPFTWERERRERDEREREGRERGEIERRERGKGERRESGERAGEERGEREARQGR
jgi:hypothetical protein